MVAGIFKLENATPGELRLFRKTIARVDYPWERLKPKLQKLEGREHVIVRFGDPGSNPGFERWGVFSKGIVIIRRKLPEGAQRYTIAHEAAGHVIDAYGLDKTQRRDLMTLMRPRPPEGSRWWGGLYNEMPGEVYADSTVEAAGIRSPLDSWYKRDVPLTSLKEFKAVVKRPPPVVIPPDDEEPPVVLPPTPPEEDPIITELREDLATCQEALDEATEALFDRDNRLAQIHGLSAPEAQQPDPDAPGDDEPQP
jgi:hypothetical protein